jgi:hypothetical protein
MSIVLQNTRLRSRLKFYALRAGRGLGYVRPRGWHNGSPRWAPDLVTLPQDSERAVEIPWAASGIANCVGLWLDIGYAHAERRYWESLPTKGWRRYLRYGYGFDLTEPRDPDPLPTHIIGDLLDYDMHTLPRFDLITCISTLEHLGCDNTLYHALAVRRENPFDLQQRVLRRLLTALTRRGTLLVTLPYGAFQDHGWFLQYDVGMVRRLGEVAADAGRGLRNELYYQLQSEGWRRVPPGGLEGVCYRPEEWRAAAVVFLEFGR